MRRELTISNAPQALEPAPAPLSVKQNPFGAGMGARSQPLGDVQALHPCPFNAFVGVESTARSRLAELAQRERGHGALGNIRQNTAMAAKTMALGVG